MKKIRPVPAPVSEPTRRKFLLDGTFLGGALMAAASCPALADSLGGAGSSSESTEYDFANPENAIYTSCLNCNTGCGIKVKLQDGIATKIDGNPYNPWTLYPHLPMKASPFDAAMVDGSICPKGQAGVQSAYDPYRIRKVLKRAGKRGENKWVTIPFDQAVKEIMDGGKLFANVPGEESREVEGLRKIRALTDKDVAKAMAADIKAYWDEKDKEKKAALLAEFKTKHAANLDKLIDPEHPDFGPKNNQFVMSWGRMKSGRGDFMRRFGAAYGTTNLHGHTTVCQGSLYFTGKAMSEQYDQGKFSGGQKFYWQADTENSKFVLFVGANLMEGNYGPPNRSVRMTENLVQGRTKIAVVDPRFSKLASKAWKWLPIKPGMDGALAMAFIRWMLENKRYDAAFLANANKAAAAEAGELTWSNATWLVALDEKGKPGAFMRAADAKLARAETRKVPDPKDKEKFTEYEEKFMLVMREGKPVAFDPNDEKTAVVGDLFVDATLPDGTRVKTGLQLIQEAAAAKSHEEWCALAELDPGDVIEVVRELTSHGKHAAVDIHRGVSQHTNGFYNVLGWYTVNAMLGNFDWKGGMSASKTYGYDGSKGGPFDLTAAPGKLTTFGISLIRHDVAYDKTSLFKSYPAQRNWYPLASDVYEEIIPSIGEAYPYPIKALFTYMGAPTYALPAGHTNIDVLVDVNKLPLYFCSDILVGSTSMYADYIFPDLTYLERWEFQGSHPNMTVKADPIRQPAIAPIPEDATVYGEAQPIGFETLLLAFAEQFKFKAFGKNGLGEGLDLIRPDDFYIRAVTNMAAGAKPELADAVPDADAKELAMFEAARKHLPATVYDVKRWKALAGPTLWPKVVYLLNRGGRFQDFAKAYKGDQLGNPYGKLLCLYQEKTAKTKHAGTGKSYPGYAVYVPQATYGGKPLDEMASGHELQLITHRVISATKSRTISNYWLRPLLPENSIQMNPVDARKYGLDNGQQVRVVSSTNPAGEWDFKNGKKRAMTGRLEVTETLRPGVVSFALGWGHWATGADDITVDGKVVKGDPRRAAGIHANAAMWTDPDLKHNTCLFDPLGGSVSFYDTMVKILPA